MDRKAGDRVHHGWRRPVDGHLMRQGGDPVRHGGDTVFGDQHRFEREATIARELAQDHGSLRHEPPLTTNQIALAHGPVGGDARILWIADHGETGGDTGRQGLVFLP